MKKVAIVSVLVWLTISSFAASAGPDDAVVESYRGDSSLPDWATYRLFLSTVEALANEPVPLDHLMIRAFGIDQSSSEAASKVDFFRSWFFASASAIDQEMASETRRILCPNDFSEMAFEDIVSGMYSRLDVLKRLYNEHYLATLDQLSREERSAFQSHLLHAKRHSSTFVLDLTEHYGNDAEREIRSIHANVCANSLDESPLGGYDREK